MRRSEQNRTSLQVALLGLLLGCSASSGGGTPMTSDTPDASEQADVAVQADAAPEDALATPDAPPPQDASSPADVLVSPDSAPPADAAPPADVTPTCVAPAVACDGRCVDVRTDPDHCGACDRACVMGAMCVAGACMMPEPPPPPCTALTGACTMARNCCDMASCRPYRVGGESLCCREVNEACATSQDCCGQMLCDAGRCACRAAGATCAADADCCAGNRCMDGVCRAPSSGMSNVRHVVLIVQENHTFDNHFGQYCRAAAGSNPTCTTGPACCEAAPSAEPRGARPMSLTDDFNLADDPNHDYRCEVEQINGGRMDRFVSGSSIGSALCSSACSRPGNFAVAPRDTVAAYWQWADTGALADRYFQPIAGGTSSNDMYFAVARFQFFNNDLAPRAAGAGCFDPIGICIDGTLTRFTGRTTLVDLLLRNGNSFGVYAQGYGDAAAAGASCPSIPSDCDYNRILHPINARSCLYDPSDIPFQYYDQLTDDPRVMRDYSRFAADVAARRLPDVSFLKARTSRNEHPEYSTITRGVRFATDIVNAVLASPYASDTLILITWDEGGGFFDHVPPPAPVATRYDALPDGSPVPYGTRVPLIAIGRFARRGAVSHVTLEHSSIVRFLEWNFLGAARMGALGNRDAAVRSIGSLLDATAVGVTVPD